MLQRLAALVPRPRLHLIRFHGVLAPNARLRARVVPQGSEVAEQATEAAVAGECEAEHRVLLAAQPQLVTPVLQVVQRAITRHLLDAAELPADEGQGGAVTLIQRFGSAGNLSIHLHCLVLDGVYRRGADGAPTFVETEAPADDELHALLQTVITRLMKMLTRRGVLVEDIGQTYLAEPDADDEDARTLRPLQAAAVTYRIAFGPRAGQKVLTLRGAMPREAPARQPLCADIDGFSLHAAVRVEAHDRKRLE